MGVKRNAVKWTLIWVAAAITFGVFVTASMGQEAGEQFFAAYLLEKSLSVDNLFVFVIIFAALGTPQAQQQRVLSYGIAGALISRALFVGLGASLLQNFTWMVFVFGGVLLITGLKLLRPAQHEGPPKFVPWLQRHIRSPLVLAIVAIEATDILFAIDSVPAAFAITDDTFIIYTSNIFALLGLRALFGVLGDLLTRLRYLRYGLAAVLAFAGSKMIASHWVHIPPLLSVGVILGCLAVAALASRRRSGATMGHAPGLDRDSTAAGCLR